MYARVTTYQADTSKLAEIEAKMDEVRRAVAKIDGIISTYTVWRADGRGVTMSIYESEQAAEIATQQVSDIWADMAVYIVGAPQIEAFDSVAHIKG